MIRLLEGHSLTERARFQPESQPLTLNQRQSTARIVVGLATESSAIREAAVAHADYVKGETLAVELKFEPLPDVAPTTLKIDGDEVAVFVKVKDA